MDIDPTTLGAVLVVLTPLALLIVRIFVLPDGTSLDDLIAPRIDLDWPRDVQEEEPVPWRVERLTPRGPSIANAAPTPLPVSRAHDVDVDLAGLESKPAA
jgi:hypothetical protein